MKRSYFVHDRIVQKAGAGIGRNNFSVAFGSGEATIVYYAPVLAHVESGTKWSGLYYNNFSGSLAQLAYAIDLSKVTSSS